MLNDKPILLTLSDPAFSVVRQGRGCGLRGPDAKNEGYHQQIEMKVCTSHYSHKSILDANFECGSSSGFGDMTSQNFSLTKGASYQIRLFTSGKRVFMFRIVLLDPKLTPMSLSAIFKQRKYFHFQNFGGVPMRKDQQQHP